MAVKHIALIGALLLLPPAALGQGAAVPATAPGGVVMMQPIADSNPGGDADAGQPRPSNIRVLSPADHALFVRAFALGAREQWAEALALGNQGSDTVARQLLQWRYALDKNSGAKFADIDAAMKFAAAWPLKGTLQARAEAAITPDMTPAAIIQWFAGREPNSSIGRVRLGEALVASGQAARGGPLIARGWAEGSFDDATIQSILTQDSAYLTPESDRTRLDNLLWRGETTAARQEMSRVDAQTAAIARARILLSGGTRLAQPALDAVAGSSDPALLYDWARALRLEHNDDAAHQMLMRVAPATLVQGHAARWWAEVNVEARDMLMTGDARGALAMVEHAGLSAGDEYVDQQFLGGFIALRFLKDASEALPWFQRLTAAVSRPISKSRGEYWQGRAYEALGQTASAISHYRLAAAYPETFYGQLALARTQTAPVLHLNDSDVVAADKSEIESDPLMPEIRVLADLGQGGDLRLFAEADTAAGATPRCLKAFLEALMQWGYPEAAVRLAKAASYAGDSMLAYTHPVIALPAYRGDGNAPDPALVLGLIRQETEFDAYAVSSAGARGLMQVMTFTAKKSARLGHLPYSPDDLLSDRDYNIELGAIEFAGHLDYWGNSIVLAAAGYNAGDANARRWVTALGDPRNGAVDPLDFIEQIPFSETRNYVQRVLENTEVYRNRLAGRDMPLQILSDLYAPMAPTNVVLDAPAAAAAPVKRPN